MGRSLSGSKSLSVQVSSLSENFLLPSLLSVGRTASADALSRKARMADDRFIFPDLAPGAEGGGGVATLSATCVFALALSLSCSLAFALVSDAAASFDGCCWRALKEASWSVRFSCWAFPAATSAAG